MAENESKFFGYTNGNSDNIDIKKFEHTWYCSLTKLLTENVKKSEIEDIFDNLEIINFNYDRCLEHYLPISLSNYYGVEVGHFREIMSNLVIHRPYGVAGRLPWQQGDGPSVGFGDCSPNLCGPIANQIRTFTERVEEAQDLALIRNSMSRADRIIFLGFAFHRQNVDLLARRLQDHAEIIATAYKISESDRSVIEEELSVAFEQEEMLKYNRIRLSDMTCKQFFDEHWRTITADPSEFPSLNVHDLG